MKEQPIPAHVGPRIGSQEDLHAVPGGPEVLRPLCEVRAVGTAGVAAGRPGRKLKFNRKKFGLSFGLKSHLSFGLRFPKLRKSLKKL